MEVLDLLKGASELVYKAVKDMAGTDEWKKATCT